MADTSDKVTLIVKTLTGKTFLLDGDGAVRSRKHSIPSNMSIKLCRTVRVPDNKSVSALPPSLGNLPLYRVSEYENQLNSLSMSCGDFFTCLYEREAFGINFSVNSPFALRMYLGDVNFVSGEPRIETPATLTRRLNLPESKESIQDYVVVPKQHWLDGVTAHDGLVRQFVAMQSGMGYSVQAQVTGGEAFNGISFEVVPCSSARDLKLSLGHTSQFFSTNLRYDYMKIDARNEDLDQFKTDQID